MKPAGGFGHQVDQPGIDRAGGKLGFDLAVDLVIKSETVARAGFFNDGKQRIGRSLAALEELRVDVKRAKLAGRIPEWLPLRADAHGIGFKQPGDDRVFHREDLLVFICRG